MALKRKTSISLSASLLNMIDRLPDNPARSEVIEEALIFYFKSRKAQLRDRADQAILDEKSEGLNAEALDVLEYQTK